MNMTRQTHPSRTVAGTLALLGSTALALSLFGAATWFAWLGWDHQYYEVNGVSQGPYRAWQVIGCALSLAAGSVAAYRVVRMPVAILALAAAAAIGFAVPWGIDASSDDTGLWMVGLIFLLVGSGIGLVLVLSLTAAATAWRDQRVR